FRSIENHYHLIVIKIFRNHRYPGRFRLSFEALLHSVRSRAFTALPIAETGHRQRMGGAHLAAGQHGFEDGVDETVVRAAHGALAVGADVDQFAALVPDAYRRAGWQLF